MSGGKTNWIVFLPFVINWHDTLWLGFSLPWWRSSSHSAPSPSLVLVVPGLQDAFVSQPESWVFFQCFTQGSLTHEHWWMPNAWNSAKDKRCTDMKWAPRSSNRMETKVIFIKRYLSTQSHVLRKDRSYIPLSWGGMAITCTADLSCLWMLIALIGNLQLSTWLVSYSFSSVLQSSPFGVWVTWGRNWVSFLRILSALGIVLVSKLMLDRNGLIACVQKIPWAGREKGYRQHWEKLTFLKKGGIRMVSWGEKKRDGSMWGSLFE